MVTATMPQTLQHRFESYMRAERRLLWRIVGGFCVITGALLVIAHVLIRTLGALFSYSKIDDRLRGSWSAAATEHVTAFAQFFVDAVLDRATLPLWYVILPAVAACAVVYALAGFSVNQLHRRLYRHPALAEQFLARVEPELHSWRSMAKRITVIGIVGAAAWGLSWGFARQWSNLVLLLIATALLFSVVGLRASTVKRLGVQRTLSPLYVRQACITHFLQMGSHITAIAVLVSCVLVLLHTRDRALVQEWNPRFQEQLAAWTDQIENLAQVRIAEQDRLREIPERFTDLVQKMNGLTLSGAFDDVDVAALWATAIFLFCVLGYVTVGEVLMALDLRRTVAALLFTLVVVVVLEWAASKSYQVLDRLGVLDYASRLGITLAFFVAGQLTGFLIRVHLEARDSCPRCSFPVDTKKGHCAVCGTDMRLIQKKHFVGNMVSRELHAADCHHARRMAVEKRQDFQSAEEAYWQGYDNCGTCLGGSGYWK